MIRQDRGTKRVAGVRSILGDSSGPILLTAFSQPEGQLDKAVQIARISRLSVGVIGSLRLVHGPQHVADVKPGSINAGGRSISEGRQSVAPPTLLRQGAAQVERRERTPDEDGTTEAFLRLLWAFRVE